MISGVTGFSFLTDYFSFATSEADSFTLAPLNEFNQLIDHRSNQIIRETAVSTIITEPRLYLLVRRFSRKIPQGQLLFTSKNKFCST